MRDQPVTFSIKKHKITFRTKFHTSEFIYTLRKKLVDRSTRDVQVIYLLEKLLDKTGTINSILIRTTPFIRSIDPFFYERIEFFIPDAVRRHTDHSGIFHFGG